MSLADQSQQWFPTSVQVTVHQARNLRAKGKNGTNDAYAIIQVAKDKFSTTVSERCVDPVWKEEASFDLPLFSPSDSDRCTLYIIVMHRAQVGLDKFLGQAVVNLLELHDNNPRKKTDWFKLVDKSKKEDKARGEVLLDIQFMRNNMSASMFDLSTQDKPRSRISKLKDKVRGKKKDGFSDSSSAIVPSVSKGLTDSEEEADTQSLNQSEGGKKKSKLKKLFAPKSNLHRNISQSMSTLGTLPEKNSSISSSRSSGLNVDTPEVKKKFKFLGHKRTGSSDSKVSLGSLLGRSKQSTNDLNNLCINGSHVYEENEPPSGSTLSLNSSGQGSVEDVRQFREICVDSFIPSNRQEATLEQQRHQEEEERRQAELRSLAEARRLEEEEKYRVEARRMQEEEERRLQEEQERKRRFYEDEARREAEEEMRRQQEAAENQRMEEERRKAEEQKRQEEASMSDRLSSLFGMIRKKEEKKVEPPTTPPESEVGDQPASNLSTNPFVDVPLSSDPTDPQRTSLNPQSPSSTAVFINRNAKVSAVKPRFTQCLESEPDCQTPSQLCPSPTTSTLSSIPAESPETFSSLHTSLAPAILSQTPSEPPSGIVEDLTSVGSSPDMAEKKRRAPTPSSYTVSEEADAPQQVRKMSLPLPDYDTLFPQKRHGVQGHTRWDHIIAEVNQKHRDFSEMSVDGPAEDYEPSVGSSLPTESPTASHYETHQPKPPSSKKTAAPAPPQPDPKPVADLQSQYTAYKSPLKPQPAVPEPVRESLGHWRTPAALQPPRTSSLVDLDTPAANDQRASLDKDAPTAKPRQRGSGKEPVKQDDPVDKHMKSDFYTYTRSNIRKETRKETDEFDPFPSTNLLSSDPWAAEEDDFFTIGVQKEQKLEDQGMTRDDLDKIFSQEKQTDPFADFNGRENTKKEEHSPAFQRKNSPRQKLSFPSTKSRQEPEEESQVSSARSARNGAGAAKTETKPQSGFYGEDQFGAEPFTPAGTFSEPLQVVLEEAEPVSPPGGLSGGKAPLRAWVSPSDVQPVSAQNSNGGGLAFTPRRPHPVKPMSSESPFGPSAVKEIKVRERAAGKAQVSDPVESGPFTQLTQEELITLVVRQQADLSRKDSKIVELEEYIDNLLVRVIDQQPSILHALNAKPV